MPNVLLSCGVLVLNTEAELLLCHSTGSPRWDIPKGVGEPGESEVDAAIRETFEEAGLTFEPAQLLDLGRFKYLRGKDLHLYATLTERFDTHTCQCTSFWEDRRGRLLPEVDAYAWTAFDEVPSRCGKSLAALFAERLSLPEVLARLRSRTPLHG